MGWNLQTVQCTWGREEEAGAPAQVEPLSWPCNGATVRPAQGPGPRPLSWAQPFAFWGTWRKVSRGPSGRRAVLSPGGWPLPPEGRALGSSSELDLKAEAVEALAVRELAGAGAVAEGAAAGAARGPTSFAGLGAARIQEAARARQREVAGFRAGPATVLGLRGALLPAGGAAVRAAALGQQAVPSEQHQAQQQQIDAHSDEDNGGDGERQGRVAGGSWGWTPRARSGLEEHRRMGVCVGGGQQVEEAAERGIPRWLGEEWGWGGSAGHTLVHYLVLSQHAHLILNYLLLLLQSSRLATLRTPTKHVSGL